MLALIGAYLTVTSTPASCTPPVIVLSAPSEISANGARNPTVAVDGTHGVVYLAWAQERSGPTNNKPSASTELDAMLAHSDDGGEHFGAARVINAAQDNIISNHVNPVHVAVGTKGQAYVLFSYADAALPNPAIKHQLRAMRMVRSEDGGKTFSAPIAIGDKVGNGVPTSPGMSNLFVSPDGTLYVSWLDPRSIYAYAMSHNAMPSGKLSVSQLRVARSDDGGKSFAPSTMVEASTCVCCGTHVAQGASGPLYASTRAAWYELKGSVDAVRDIFVASSQDRGATWERPVKVHDDQFKISACPDVNEGLQVDGQGRLHVAWYTGSDRNPGVFYAVSSDGGKSFGPPLALLRDGWVPYADVRLALDQAGNAWVAFADRRGDVDQIRLVRINIDGSVSSAEPWPGVSPDLATRPDGSVVLTWGGVPPDGAEEAGDIYTRIARVVAVQP